VKVLPIDAALAERLYRRARADAVDGCRSSGFAEALERSAERGANPDSLHLETWRLACGVRGGDEAAWEHSFANSGRRCIGRPTRSIPGGSGRELADGIYGELFAALALSLFFTDAAAWRTWLRAVLAQRHVSNRVRAGRQAGAAARA
jgi:hypothetical protein